MALKSGYLEEPGQTNIKHGIKEQFYIVLIFITKSIKVNLDST